MMIKFLRMKNLRDYVRPMTFCTIVALDSDLMASSGEAVSNARIDDVNNVTVNSFQEENENLTFGAVEFK